jgi:hypothetical protein
MMIMMIKFLVLKADGSVGAFDKVQSGGSFSAVISGSELS